MSQKSRTGEPAGSWSRHAGPILLGLIALGMAGARFHTFDEPLPRDITTYALIGHGLLEGRELYSDLWDHKPPAIHVTYAAAEAIAGFGESEVYLLSLAAALATLFGVYSLGRRAGNGAGLWAALFWSLIAFDMLLEGNEPNTEGFINACLTWALVFWLRASANRSRGFVLASGGLFAAASLYKPVVVATPIVLVVVWWMFSERDGTSRPRRLERFAWLAAPGLLAWVALFGYFALLGRLNDFSDAVFAFNRYYAGDMVWNLATALRPDRLAPERLWFVAPLAGLGLVGLVRHFLISSVGPGDRNGWLAWLAWCLGSLLAIAWPGRDYPHYYQLWLPVLSVGAAWGVASLARAAAMRRWGAVILAGLAAVWLFAHAVPSYRISAEQWSTRKFQPLFVESKRLGREIDALLEPEETFFNWGAATGLYFYSERRPPSGVFYMRPVTRGPLRDRLSERLLGDLERARPELVVWQGRWPPGPRRKSLPVVRWIVDRYHVISHEASRGRFLLLARNGGRLDRSTDERILPDAS